MATARSIASLSLSFGLVSIPVRLYSATESSATVRFNMLAPDGSRVEQQYVSKATGKKVERAEMNKGYEFEKGKFVVFTPDELKALEESPSHLVEILAFVPDKAIDPIYYDRAYFIAPDKRGGKPYSLLQRALLASGRCALASWNNKGKTYMVQIRATEDGLVFQQLLWGAEVRSLKDLDIEQVPVSDGELKLALQIIAQGESDHYDPDQYENVEQKRVLAAIDAKIEGQQIVAPAEEAAPAGGQVIDLMDALRASLTRGGKQKASAGKATSAAEVSRLPATKRARTVKRAEASPPPAKRARK
ncbi:Non-homologous end joining protein Ku [Paraburkholderia tropica]|uniref:non-homologous end joining protein Ku n=1 Tax=Paraburkholderia tropica TaxID=92647 RepID=UPI001CAE7991|nr:Ku protein [Paraburkholderia tropica]CAG9207543.1 Non-homologous end joining protein Ku [Paraburkholderia tropica]